MTVPVDANAHTPFGEDGWPTLMVKTLEKKNTNLPVLQEVEEVVDALPTNQSNRTFLKGKENGETT